MMHDIPVFDSDGHIDEDHVAISDRLPGDYRNPARRPGTAVFPSLDGWSRGVLVNRGDPQRRYRHTSAEIIGEVLGVVGLQGSVLYPTEGLAVGLMQDSAHAGAVCSAYNDWLEAEYTARDSRLFGVGLMPVQDPAAAVAELSRCRTRTGFVAMLLPSVLGRPTTYGDAAYWPIYEAAERQGMPLAVHGGPAGFPGMPAYDDFAKVHTLSHPLPLLSQVTDIVLSGVFDAFPNLRIAFLEAGCGWAPYWMDRMDHEFGTLNGLALRKRLRHPPSHYFRDTDNVWISFELEERTLGTVLDVIGSERLLYASDYGHESRLDVIAQEVAEFVDRPDLSRDTKARLLGGNGRRLYGLP
jgi:uncharacterized protein